MLKDNYRTPKKRTKCSIWTSIVMLLLAFGINHSALGFTTHNIKGNASFWSQKNLDQSKTYNHPFKDPFVSTMWTDCHMEDYKIEKSKLTLMTLKFYNPHFKKSLTPHKIYLQKDSIGRVTKSPLIFYVPGMFAKTTNHITIDTIARLTNLGYHVAVFPNTWSTEYLDFLPKAPMGSLENEANSLYFSMQEITKTLREADYLSGKIQLLGLSHGAFTSSILAAIDAKAKKPIIDGGVTLISSPFNLYEAGKRMDQAFEDTKEKYASRSLVKLGIEKLKICRADNEFDIDDELRLKAKGLVSWIGFHSALRKTVDRYLEITTGKGAPSNYWIFKKKRFNNWKQALSFESVLDHIVPSIKPMFIGNHGSMHYWIEQTKNTHIQIRGITSRDDFLNSNVLPDSIEKNQNWILLPRGGHFGFRLPKTWYDQFFNEAFKIN